MANKKLTPGKAAVREWRRFVKTNEPKIREILFQSYLRGVRTGQAYPRKRDR